MVKERLVRSRPGQLTAAALLALALAPTGCGSGSDDAPAPSPNASEPVKTVKRTETATVKTVPREETNAPLADSRTCEVRVDPQPIKVVAGKSTSCLFAGNVATEALADVQTADREFEISAFSPALDRDIPMTCTADADGIECRGGRGAVVQLITTEGGTSDDAAEGGRGPNDATPDAPSQTAESKGLRAYLRKIGAEEGAAWANSIDEDETVLTERAGAAAAITVNGAPTQQDLEEVCAAAMRFRDDMAFATASNPDGSASADC